MGKVVVETIVCTQLMAAIKEGKRWAIERYMDSIDDLAASRIENATSCSRLRSICSIGYGRQGTTPCRQGTTSVRQGTTCVREGTTLCREGTTYFFRAAALDTLSATTFAK